LLDLPFLPVSACREYAVAHALVPKIFLAAGDMVKNHPFEKRAPARGNEPGLVIDA
jgi:hypothetical protein